MVSTVNIGIAVNNIRGSSGWTNDDDDPDGADDDDDTSDARADMTLSLRER
jgi:hypothetical protein